MAHLPRLTALLLVSALAACGGKAFDTDEPDPNPGGSSQGATGNVGAGDTGGGAGKAGSGQGGTGNAGGTGQGGSAGSVCESFDDHPGYYVSVALINKTSAPIHLGQEMVTCDMSPFFSVRDASGMLLPSPGNCRSDCQSVRTSGPVGCPSICRYPSAVTLQPGDTLVTAYDGLYEVQHTLPEQCLADLDYAQCNQARQIQPGTFTFSARAGSSLDCSATSGTCNNCMPTGEGGCTTLDGLISGEMHNATATVFLDSSYGVYGGPYPAPAPAFPGEPDDDSSAGAIAQLTVELIFTD